MNDVEKLEEKIQCLEESIIEFENSHIKQVNNLIDLFSDVIDIIKDKKVEDSDKKILIENKEEDSNDIELNLPEIDINENNEFKNKSTKEIIDYIYRLTDENLTENEEIANHTKEEIEEESNEAENDIPSANDILKELDNLKVEDILEPQVVPIENENIIVLKDTYKIEKNIVPVDVWINAFKNTDRWKAMNNKLKSYSIEENINKEMEMI